MALIGTTSTEHTLHDTNVVPAGSVGFIPQLDGNFEGRAEDDAADRTFYVKAGLFYPISLTLAKTTGATGVTQLLIIHGSRR